MAAIILLQKNDTGVGCHKFHVTSCWLSMRAFSWMIGPDIVSALSLACYHSSIQTNIVTRFWRFFLREFILFHFFEYHRFEALAFTSFIISYFSLHDKRCLFVFSDIISSVKKIRNHVSTAALPAAWRTARRLQRLSPFIVSLEKYLATDLHSFTCPPCLALSEVLLRFERGLFQMNRIQRHNRIHHTSSKTMQLYVYIRRKCLSFL